jgi:hypothetical protein
MKKCIGHVSKRTLLNCMLFLSVVYAGDIGSEDAILWIK